MTEDQVVEVLGHFGGDRVPSHVVTTAKRNPGTETASAFRADGLPSEWHWEGHVQAALIRYLTEKGWAIDRHSDTASREQGPDIAASRPGRKLLIEVKGYPSVGYRDPRRAAEVKRTNPSLQAKHWYAEALLKVIRMQNAAPRAEIAIGLPAATRYESLLMETSGALRLLGIGLLVVDETGDVTVAIEARNVGA